MTSMTMHTHLSVNIDISLFCLHTVATKWLLFTERLTKSRPIVALRNCFTVSLMYYSFLCNPFLDYRGSVMKNYQSVFSFSITCLVLQLFTVLKYANSL